MDILYPLFVQFYKGYDKLLSKYMSKDEGVGLDLTLVRREELLNIITPPGYSTECHIRQSVHL